MVGKYPTGLCIVKARPARHFPGSARTGGDGIGTSAGAIVDDPKATKSGPFVQLSRAVDQLETDAKSRFYELRDGKIWFADDIKREHERLRTSLFHYIVHSRILAIVTAPFIYACIVPFALLDLFVSVYQAV